jgi:hypothetical protein
MIEDVIIYKVLIASPCDVLAERDGAERAIYKWNRINAERIRIFLMPVRWEADVYADVGLSSQEIMNNQIVSDCDLLIGIFASRIGTKTPKADSGTLEEIYYFEKNKLPIMLFFKNLLSDADRVDNVQFQKVQKLRSHYSKKRIYKEYSNPSEFEDIVFSQLSQRFKKTAPKDSNVDISVNNYCKSILECIYEYNERDKKPKCKEIALRCGFSKAITERYLPLLVKSKLVKDEYPSGSDAVYSITQVGVKIVIKNKYEW